MPQKGKEGYIFNLFEDHLSKINFKVYLNECYTDFIITSMRFYRVLKQKKSTISYVCENSSPGISSQLHLVFKKKNNLLNTLHTIEGISKNKNKKSIRSSACQPQGGKLTCWNVNSVVANVRALRLPNREPFLYRILEPTT